jgi:hypothetical protein
MENNLCIKYYCEYGPDAWRLGNAKPASQRTASVAGDRPDAVTSFG